MTLPRTLGLLRQIAAALDAAHAKRVIHRDMKPGNVMLVRREDGREQVKVLDFGLAKLADQSTDLVSSAVGTPNYASPEQFHAGSEIDGRADIYALGVMLYEMLAGELPFKSPSIAALVHQHLLELPPQVRSLRPDVPQEIEELIQRMMAKSPHYRPERAGEAVTIFEQALGQQTAAELR
jgi:serine/threonine-protein kinase